MIWCKTYSQCYCCLDGGGGYYTEFLLKHAIHDLQWISVYNIIKYEIICVSCAVARRSCVTWFETCSLIACSNMYRQPPSLMCHRSGVLHGAIAVVPSNDFVFIALEGGLRPCVLALCLPDTNIQFLRSVWEPSDVMKR